jgi:hypothetical protein
MLFGDSIFRGLLQYITTYYHGLLPNVLMAKEVKINATFRAAQMPIEKNMASPIAFLESVTQKEATS